MSQRPSGWASGLSFLLALGAGCPHPRSRCPRQERPRRWLSAAEPGLRFCCIYAFVSPKWKTCAGSGRLGNSSQPNFPTGKGKGRKPAATAAGEWGRDGKDSVHTEVASRPLSCPQCKLCTLAPRSHAHTPTPVTLARELPQSLSASPPHAGLLTRPRTQGSHTRTHTHVSPEAQQQGQRVQARDVSRSQARLLL